LGRLTQGGPPGGSLPPSASMLQLLAALDSPTGRLSEGLAAAAAEAGEALPPSLSSTSLSGLASSSSVSNLRSLLRNASSGANLSELADAGSLEQHLHSFAALARSASLQSSLANQPAHPTGVPAMAPPPSPGARRESASTLEAAWGQGGAQEGTDMLLPTDMMRDNLVGLMRESPSVSSLVELVRSSSASSLVELMHSYSATNLASLVRDDGPPEP